MITKPRAKKVKLLDFSECTDFIEKKHRIDTRDYARHFLQSVEWFKAKGYTGKDPEGKGPGESQIWFAEYRAAIKRGEVIERPYQDFWHFLIDTHDVQRGGHLELDPESAQEPWQKEIMAFYVKEFGTGPYHTDW